MAMNESTGGIWLTQSGFQKLQQELEHLTMVKRPEIAERIRASQEHGEFSEDNNELGEVKFEQAIIENRIADLKSIFGAAQVLDPDSIPNNEIGIGSHVMLEDLDYREKFNVQVVSTIEANPNEDLISNESPMGQALWGAKAGETIIFEAPDGPKRFKVIAIGSKGFDRA